MSGHSPQTWPPSKWPLPDWYLDRRMIEGAAQRLIDTQDSHSLDAMRTALWATMHDKRTRDILTYVWPTLQELELALTMLAQGELHPAFEIKKRPYGGRRYSPVQERFLEVCFVASEILVAMGQGRKKADDEVKKWGAATAEQLRVSFRGKKTLTNKRTELGWHAWCAPLKRYQVD